MKNLFEANKKNRIISGTVLLIISLLFFYFLSLFSIFAFDDILHSNKTTAYVESYSQGICGSRSKYTCYSAVVNYHTRANVILHAQLDARVTDRPYIGEPYTIFYRLDQPLRIHLDSFANIFGLFLSAILGVLLLAASVYSMFFWYIYEWRLNRLKAYGQRVDAKIKNIESKTTGRRRTVRYRLVAIATNQLTGNEEMYRSAYLDTVPPNVIGLPVTIYVRQNNAKKYLFDFRSVQ